MRPVRPKQYCLQLDLGLWHSSTLPGRVGIVLPDHVASPHPSISTALTRPIRPKQYCLQLHLYVIIVIIIIIVITIIIIIIVIIIIIIVVVVIVIIYTH